MRESLRRRLSFANVVSVIALFVALGGVGYAAIKLPKNSVGSKQIKDGQVKGGDLGPGSISSGHVADGSLLGEDFAAGQLPAGPRGPAGADGQDGQDGLDGSPDTPSQVLEKVSQVDGPSSGLNADLLDGRDADGYAQVGYRETVQWTPGNVAQGECKVLSTSNGQSQVNPGDSLVVTTRGMLWNTAMQVTGTIGPDAKLYATLCNNGSFGTLTQSELAVTFLVLR
jgi:hypothetical protein